MKIMNDQLDIKFNKDDVRTSIKMIVFMASIGVLFVLLVFMGWRIFLFGAAAVFIIKGLISIPDGEILIHFLEGKKFLSKSSRKGLVFKDVPISYIAFSWNYRFEKSRHSDYSGEKPGHTNYIQLKLEIELESHYRIVVYEELYPWQEIPKDWNYKIFDKTRYDECLFIKGDLKKVKHNYEGIIH